MATNSIRWSAHVATLWRELPLLQRFKAAAEAGFCRAECWSPFDCDLDDFTAAVRSSGIELTGFNLHAGDMAGGDRGLLNLPERRDAILANTAQAVGLATTLGSRAINALVGNDDGRPRAAQLDTVVDRLGEIARRAEGTDVVILVEALCAQDNARYLLHTAAAAAEVVERVDHPQVRMLFDAYHVATSGENLVAQFDKYQDMIAHVQIADTPGRHEPGSGNVDFGGFFAAVQASGYRGTVGLEYIPSSETAASLAWLPLNERDVSARFPTYQEGTAAR